MHAWIAQRAVVTAGALLRRPVQRVPEPDVAVEQAMVRPQCQGLHGVAIHNAAALTRADKHVIELCQPSRGVPAARVPAGPLAACERGQAACPLAERRIRRHHVEPVQQVLQRVRVAVLARGDKRCPRGPTRDRVEVPKDDQRVTGRNRLQLPAEEVEEGSSILWVGGRGCVRAEKPDAASAQTHIQPQEARRDGSQCSSAGGAD